MEPRVIISLLCFHTKNPKKVIDSILCQTYKNFELIISDNSLDDLTYNFVSQNYPNLLLFKNKNIGYGAAHNKIITRFYKEAEFSFLLNDDVILDPNYLKECVLEISRDKNLAGVCGKILELKNLETLSKNKEGLGFYYLNLARKIRPAFGNMQDNKIYGVTGAAPLFRNSSLQKLNEELFDETYFMYGEDVDLCWRLSNLGFKFAKGEKAIAYHKRSYSFFKRYSLKPTLRAKVLLNRYYSILKNEQPDNLIKKSISLFLYELSQFFYILFFDPKILSLYGTLLKKFGFYLNKRKSQKVRYSLKSF